MRRLSILLFVLLSSLSIAHAQKDDEFPPRPSPPRLVNDLANVLSADEEQLLEQKAEEFERSTSNEISIVTVQSIGLYEVAQYTTELGNRWGVGKASHNNGVLILAAIKDHRMNISVGKGLEGALTDLQCNRIIQNELRPAFREDNYYRGFDNAIDAIVAATKGEYKAEPKVKDVGSKGVITAIIIFLIILWIIRRSGGGGGTYMSRRGWGGFGGGFLTGSMFGGGWGGGGDGGGWGGGSSGGGGGFGGFGGGSFGGGGASGSW